MKKSLIALLVATLPAAAFAEVTIYGKIKGGAESGLDFSAKQLKIEDIGSHIGFKGQEDLGNGVKAIWQVESGFSVDGKSATFGPKTGTFANRNSFAGLETNMGTLRLGNLSNFLDSDMGVVDGWQYTDSALGLAIFSKNSGRMQKSIRYDLPSTPGFRAAVQYVPKEDTSPTSNSRATTIAGVGYEQNNLFLKYAYMHESRAVPSGTTAFDNVIRSQINAQQAADPVRIGNDAHRVEAGYNDSKLLLAVGYQEQKGGLDIIDEAWSNMVADAVDVTQLGKLDSSPIAKTRELAVTTGYKIGSFTPKFTYAISEKLDIGGVKLGNTNYSQYVVGLDYSLSPRTTFAGQFGHIDIISGGKLAQKGHKAVGINMSHAF